MLLLLLHLQCQQQVSTTRISGQQAAPYSSHLRFQNQDTQTYRKTGQAFNIDSKNVHNGIKGLK